MGTETRRAPELSGNKLSRLQRPVRKGHQRTVENLRS
ncbi:rCG30075 [Rattus norvegicus]|uniref:RCG30075 n=1 Tax=Rattus norvegicus TaxID=10116 RepID=A6ILP1_RAT|nr:rCG30075 [Rattus norvegicus]